MTPATVDHIDELMEKATTALTHRDYFSAERLANKAVRMAWKKQQYDLMCRIVMPLQEARRQRTQLAFDAADDVRVVDQQPVTEEFPLSAGCYLVQPLAVGADARQLRILGLQQEIPIAVVCCEPPTRIGMIPIVAVGAGVTIRNRIDPPEEPASETNPGMPWFAEAMQALGDAAIDMIDPTMEIHRPVGFVLDYLDAVPEHEQLHHALVDVCEEAHRLQRDKQRKKA